MTDNDKKLIQGGYIPHRSGVVLTKQAKLLFDLWQKFLSDLFKQYKYQDYKSPVTIDKVILQRSQYLKNFPNQVIESRGFKNHASTQYLTPAACLHVYPFLSNSQLKQTSKSLIISHCGRFENNKHSFPFRLSGFNMLEFVVVGTENEVNKIAKEAFKKIVDAFNPLRLNGKFEIATDAFFLSSKGSEIIQRLKGLKQEYRVSLNSKNTALASINRHEEYFGKLFNIKIDNEYAHSVCIAFGLERLVAYSLIKWGVDHKKWPKEFRHE